MTNFLTMGALALGLLAASAVAHADPYGTYSPYNPHGSFEGSNGTHGAPLNDVFAPKN